MGTVESIAHVQLMRDRITAGIHLMMKMPANLPINVDVKNTEPSKVLMSSLHPEGLTKKNIVTRMGHRIRVDLPIGKGTLLDNIKAWEHLSDCRLFWNPTDFIRQ